MHDLPERWSRLWDALGATGDAAPVLAALTASHGEPSRAYHDLHHVAACLDELERAQYLAENPREIELAIWFHDAVYDTHRTDNEAMSAAWASKVIRDAKITHARDKAVHDLILATTHRQTPTTNDGRLICDIDLAIFGQKPAKFDAYGSAIRKEFAWVEESRFRSERARVLEMFLHRPHLYHTAMFRGRYEAQARENLNRSLQEIHAHAG